MVVNSRILKHTKHLRLLIVLFFFLIPERACAQNESSSALVEVNFSDVLIEDLQYSSGLYGIRVGMEFRKSICADALIAADSGFSPYISISSDLCPKFGFWQPRLGMGLSYWQPRLNAPSWYSKVVDSQVKKPVWLGVRIQPFRFQYKAFHISFFEFSNNFNLLSESAWLMSFNTVISAGWQLGLL
jgi:hypothetical protein